MNLRFEIYRYSKNNLKDPKTAINGIVFMF